jgi:hypothetical protein
MRHVHHPKETSGARRRWSGVGSKSRKARSEHIPSGLPSRADIVDALWHFRFVARSWRAAGIDVAIGFT